MSKGEESEGLGKVKTMRKKKQAKSGRVRVRPSGAGRRRAKKATRASGDGCPSCGVCKVNGERRGSKGDQSRRRAERKQDEILHWLRAASLEGQERRAATDRACRGGGLLGKLGLPAKYTACPMWRAVATFVQALRDIPEWDRVSGQDYSRQLESLMTDGRGAMKKEEA